MCEAPFLHQALAQDFTGIISLSARTSPLRYVYDCLRLQTGPATEFERLACVSLLRLP